MLADRDYIKGVEVRHAADGHISLSVSFPRITLAGLEYLHSNAIMRELDSNAFMPELAAEVKGKT